MRSKSYVFISCFLVVVFLCNTTLVFADSLNLSQFNTKYNLTISSDTSIIKNAITSDGWSDTQANNLIDYALTYGNIIGYSSMPYSSFPYLRIYSCNDLLYSNNTVHFKPTVYPCNLTKSNNSLSHTTSSSTSFYPTNVVAVSAFNIYDSSDNLIDSVTSVVSEYLYYNDISSSESFTNDDGITFYTGGLSLIALAYPDFYSKLQAAAAGSAGLLEWLINDIGAMFMLDPSTNDWYILNAPQNVAYYASDSANTITLYSGTITEDNTFKRDAGSVSFGTSADYWKHNNAVVKYNYQTQQFEYSNTFNGLTINRGANGVWINRGSSMLALDDPINEQREGLLHGRYVINNPSIGDNFDQYLDNSGNDTTVIDGDLYALLNEIKNWSQVDALTQKYLLNTLSEISSLTSEVIDYLGPNYLYPTITSYFDSLFRLNGLRYSAYDQNNNKVEYNKQNKSFGDVLTEEYLMLTSIGSDNRPSQYYQYDGDVKVNPLYSLWNDIKNLPDNIASKIQPIFPTIPGSNDTIIDSVGDYNNRVSLNPQNVTDTHENLTDLLSWFHLEGFSGSFSDIFGSSDRWSLWSEETYTNCGLEVDTEE